MFYVFLITLIATAMLFLHIAWHDFKHWKIENRTVLITIALFILHITSGELAGGQLAEQLNISSSLAAGVLLFVTGFVLWKVKLLGAGDAKLFFPVGLFLGWSYLMPFGFGLMLSGILGLLLLRFPMPTVISVTMIGMRFNEIRKAGKVPYAVVIVLPFLILIYYKYTHIINNI